MPAIRRWPKLPSERADRDRVIDLVTRVGRNQLRFTVYDLQAAMRRQSHLRLAHPGQLARHLRDLQGDLLVEVGRRLVTTQAPSRRAKRIFVLPHRLREVPASAPDLDPLERVYHALWVAVDAEALPAVPTNAVTAVLKSFAALGVERGMQTSTYLSTLANLDQPLVRKHTGAQGRWAAWQPLGQRPCHPDYEHWVATWRDRVTSAPSQSAAGVTTIQEAARELILLAIEAVQDEEWPAGRAVTVRDVTEAAEEEPRGRELLAVVRARGRSLAQVLHDASRRRISGGARVHARIQALETPAGMQTYFDVPDHPGAAHRALVIDARALGTALADRWLDRLRDEWSEAQRLPHLGQHPVYAACGAVRQAALLRELAGLESRLAGLDAHAAHLGPALRARMQLWAGRLGALFRMCGTLAAADARAADALAGSELDLDEVLGATRPLVTADEFFAWVPRHDRGADSPAVRLSRATTLRRFPNPHHRHRAAASKAEAAVTCVDRVEALLHLAERNATSPSSFLRAGGRLLGRDLRSAALVRPLLESPDPTDRRVALSALVLLGNTQAEAVARSFLQLRQCPDLQVDGLHALMVLGSLEVASLPVAVTGSPAMVVRQALREVVFAVRDGERLPRRLA